MKSFIFFQTFLAILIPVVSAADEEHLCVCPIEYCKAVEQNDKAAPLAEFEGEPSTTVHGCVNVITGQYCEMQTDLIVHHGVNPLTLERSYAGAFSIGPFGWAWNMNHSYMMTFHQQRDEMGYDFYVGVCECDHGNKVVFDSPYELKFDKHKDEVFHLRQKCLERGITNTAQNCLSGQTNLHNLSYNGIKGKFNVTDGSGRTRYLEAVKRVATPQYKIMRDVFPNGNSYSYDYKVIERVEDWGGRPYDESTSYIKEYSLVNSKMKSRGSFKPLKPNIHKKNMDGTLRSSDGRWVTYSYVKRDKEVGYVLTKVYSTDRPTIEYGYNSFTGVYGHCERVAKRTLPEGRVLAIDYYKRGTNELFGGSFELPEKYDPRIYRVKELKAPAGPDNTLVPIYEFRYDLNIETLPGTSEREIKNGYCDVYDALRYRVRYEFERNQRLANIQKFDVRNKRVSVERFYWEPNESPQITCLRSRGLEVDGSFVFARHYDYDLKGNVVLDSLYGNLSGQNTTPPQMEKNGRIKQTGCECYRKSQEYSQDKYNLVLKESDGNHVTRYVYEPNSNRLAAKFEGSEDKIMRRWFYRYNADAAVVFECFDDGSSTDFKDLTNVTERKLTYYTQSDVYPAAFPLIIEEKCLDLATGQEKLIHKVVNTYTNQAKITKQEHYDSENVLRYTLKWDFDTKGNLIKEINALGHEIIRSYDANGNCISESGPRPDYRKEMVYDFMNRLVKETAYHSGGVVLTTSNRYDLVGNRIAMVDPFGNETNYTYDPFGRVIEILSPSMLDENGCMVRPITKKGYDPMGHVINEVNDHGIERQMTYTIRGQIASVTHPDGTTERNIYNLDGTLKQTIGRNGTVTSYEHDVFGRPIRTEICDTEGQLLSTSSFVYTGMHLTEETDPMGQVTRYTYYPDGKMKSKTRNNRSFAFFYDTLGRLVQTMENPGSGIPEETIVRKYSYDLLNRIIEESTENGCGHLVFKQGCEYDVMGNLSKIRKYGQTGESVTETNYDSLGNPILVVDAEGNKTVTQVRYDYVNEHGQRVPYKEITDPMGMITIHIHDMHGHLEKMIKKNPFGKVIQKIAHRYDTLGNLCGLTDTVIAPDDSETECISMMQYDTTNRLVACFEALGTPEQKITKFTYDRFGQKETFIKNDGIVIQYAYDALGRQVMEKSSDGTVHYEYTYDLANHPLNVEDKVHHRTTVKTFDDNGDLEEENLGNGLTLRFTNDALGRPKKVVLPDGSAIGYQYSACLLKSVEKIDAKGTLSYSHVYDSYDLSGIPLEMTLAGKAGIRKGEYDLLGRLTSITTSFWSERITKYDAIGNIRELTLNDTVGNDSANYTYDDLYQLKEEEGIIKNSYLYDSHYNRKGKNGCQCQHNALHQLLSDGEYTYHYDLNGNLVKRESSRQTEEFAYDAFDRLIEYSNDDNVVTYTYDENHRRLSKTASKVGTMRYLYQGQNEIGSVDGSGKITELRLIGISKGAEIGGTVAMELNNVLYVPIHDHNGNICCLVEGSSGDVVETYRYSAFGERLFDTALSPWQFASKRYDDETGFVYFGRRYYDPLTGRWITPDPLGREGGINLYAYVLNSPLTHFDIYGLFGQNDSSSFFGGVCDKVGSFFSNLFQLPGKAIQTLGYHLIPIPYVKDAVEFAGWCLTGKNPSRFVPGWKREPSQLYIHEGYGDGAPNTKHVLYNGIDTSLEEFKQRCADFLKKHGGITVYGVYNNSQGTMSDLVETACQKLGIPTRMQAVSEKATREIISQLDDPATGKLIVEAHSQGAETVYNLSRDIRKMMDVTAIGPARILTNDRFASAKNLINGLDIVPLADPVGLVRGLIGGYVHYLPTTGCPVIDHLYDSKNFDNHRNKIGNFYKRYYGEVI